METEKSPVLRRMLNSSGRAFEVIDEDAYGDCYEVLRIAPKFTEDEISQPAKGWKPARRLPREVVDTILWHLVMGYIETREYDQAALALPISRGVLNNWWLWYAGDEPFALNAGDQMRQMTRMLYLLQAIYDDAYTGETGGPAYRYAAIGVVHPWGYSITNKVKPHHLVGRNAESGLFCSQLEFRQDLNRTVEGFSAPLVMYTGPRICDMMVVDVEDVEEGIYDVKKMVFPILLLRVVCVTFQKAEQWKHAMYQWARFADLVRWSMEGCTLYIEGTKVEMVVEEGTGRAQVQLRQQYVQPKGEVPRRKK